MSDNLSFLNALILRLNFGENEKRILGLFYDERLKVRRKKVARFQVYAKVSSDQPDASNWVRTMLDADRALHKLIEIRYIQKVALGTVESMLPDLVGPAAVSYEMTADGLEILQRLHPSAALKFRAWIAVLPPWLVLVGTIAGGITAAWKLIGFGIQLAYYLWH